MEQYQKLIMDLRNAGIKKGMVLLVHSSYKALGFINGSPELVIKAFQHVLTEEGTLLMPTLTYKSVSIDNPFFSYHDTKSCVGIISETFRKQKHVFRSFNPIHSVTAWGKHAEYLTKFHHLDQISLGPNSPFNLMLNHDAKILMLGCGLKPNTFMHLVENVNNLEYRKTKHIIQYKMIDRNNLLQESVGFLPDMSNYEQHYERVENILNDEELLKFDILNAKSYLIYPKSLMEKASKMLKENPFYFVEKII